MAKPLILNKPVIGVVGSAGKTTTKEMLTSILRTKWNTFKSSGNANAPSHIAKYAKQIQEYHKAAVLEYGMSKHGAIRRSCLTIKPNIGIVTNIGTAHIGNFNGSIKGIAHTKSDLIRYMKQDGLLVINADDRYSKLLDIKKFKGKILRVSQSTHSDYRAKNVKYQNKGMSFQVKINNKYHSFYIPIYGEHNVYNALSSIAVARHLGFSINNIKLGLKNFKKPYRRLSTFRLKSNVIVIDDTFSANLNATKAAIDVMDSIGEGTRVAVLGSMLEMGKFKQQSHQAVGEYLAKKKVDHIVTYGSDAKIISQGAIKAGFPKGEVVSFYDKGKLVNYLYKNVRSDSTILFKASHGMRLDKVVKNYRKLVNLRK